jgi:hypothetical protein
MPVAGHNPSGSTTPTTVTVSPTVEDTIPTNIPNMSALTDMYNRSAPTGAALPLERKHTPTPTKNIIKTPLQQDKTSPTYSPTSTVTTPTDKNKNKKDPVHPATPTPTKTNFHTNTKPAENTLKSDQKPLQPQVHPTKFLKSIDYELWNHKTGRVLTGHIDSDGEFIANGKDKWKTDFDYAREGDIEAVKLIKNFAENQRQIKAKDEAIKDFALSLTGAAPQPPKSSHKKKNRKC